MSNTLCSFSGARETCRAKRIARRWDRRSGVKWVELAGSSRRPSHASEQISNQNDSKLLFTRLYVRCRREDGKTENSTLNLGSGAAERISPKRIEIRSALCSVLCSAEACPMRKPNACRRSATQSLQEENFPRHTELVAISDIGLSDGTSRRVAPRRAPFPSGKPCPRAGLLFGAK